MYVCICILSNSLTNRLALYSHLRQLLQGVVSTKKHCGWLILTTQLKIKYLLPFTCSRKASENISKTGLLWCQNFPLRIREIIEMRSCISCFWGSFDIAETSDMRIGRYRHIYYQSSRLSPVSNRKTLNKRKIHTSDNAFSTKDNHHD